MPPGVQVVGADYVTADPNNLGYHIAVPIKGQSIIAVGDGPVGAKANPELNGDLKLLDSENAAPVELTADYDVLARYRAELAKWRIELEALARRERARKKPTPSQIADAAKLTGAHSPWI